MSWIVVAVICAIAASAFFSYWIMPKGKKNSYNDWWNKGPG